MKANIDIPNRWTGAAIVSIEIECEADATEGFKLGLAAKLAIKSGANLSGAYLSGANLGGANLGGAKDVPDFRMPDGLMFSEYLRDVVPALLRAGGKTVREIVDAGAWNCHDWTNCPMALAFDVHDLSAVPPMFRSRAEEFVRFFDGRLIPLDAIKHAIEPAPEAAERAE